MKSGMIVVCLLMTMCALPVHAGEGTIEETETTIIAEYTGDAKELQALPAGQETKSAPQGALPEGLHAVNPEADQQVSVKSDMSAHEAKSNMNEVQRKKQEARTAAQAARQQHLGGTARQPRSESEN